jgi:hypothetical protein
MATYSTSQLKAGNETPAPAPPRKVERLYTLGRCQYSSGGKVVTAEAFTELVDPDPRDLADLLEHKQVLELTEEQVNAAKIIKAMPISVLASVKRALNF